MSNKVLSLIKIKTMEREMNPPEFYEDPLDYEELFESDNLQECMNFAKEYKDFEPLENSISRCETIIEQALSEIQYCIHIAKDNAILKNRLFDVQTKLKKL